MCGRYRLAASVERLIEVFGLFPDGIPTLPPRYNIAPTQSCPVVVGPAGERVLRMMRWGLLPAWAKDPKEGARMINARAETVAARPAFRAAFRSRRCLVPADGWYEWKALGPKRKQPYRFHRADDGVFAFAGLWERWRPPDGGEAVETFTLLTTDANARVREVHDRMPVTLSAPDQDLWTDPEASPAALAALLRPAPDDAFVATPADPRLGNVAFPGG